MQTQENRNWGNNNFNQGRNVPQQYQPPQHTQTYLIRQQAQYYQQPQQQQNAAGSYTATGQQNINNMLADIKQQKHESNVRLLEYDAAIAGGMLAWSAYQHQQAQEARNAYAQAVGTENASEPGFAIWTTQMKQLRKAQPRRGPWQLSYGALVTAIVLMVLGLGAHAALFWPGVLVLVVFFISHHRNRPSASAIAQVNNWHQAWNQAGCPPVTNTSAA
jgi:hypothetical protein